MDSHHPTSFSVLLIEDNQDHADFIKGVSSLGPNTSSFEFVHVASLNEGLLEASFEKKFDVVLLDLYLPDSSGPVESVSKALNIIGETPLIILTSSNDIDLARELVQQGAQDFLVKSDLTSAKLLFACQSAIERQKLSNNLERENKDLRNFAYVVAHEIRAPLSRMISATNILRRRHLETLPEEVEEWISQSQKVLHELSAFVGQLLAFSSVHYESEVQEVAVQEVVEAIAKEFSQTLHAKSGVLRILPLPTIQANRFVVHHVFENLLSNAIKYSRVHTSPKIIVSCDVQKDKWIFSVSDNGEGIGEDDISKVFSMFARSAKTKERRGNGIGLAFCKQVLEKCGGSIEVESILGSGSTFIFWLPKPEHKE
jgi:two-component system, sensor histidine kinase and response regulator